MKLDLRRVILYAWCPLPVIEFGQSGHNDSLMLLLLMVAVALTFTKRPALSAVIVGLAILAKFTLLFALPLFLICWERDPGLGRVGSGSKPGQAYRKTLSRNLRQYGAGGSYFSLVTGVIRP